MSTDFFQLSIAKERVDALDVILECYIILSLHQATEHGFRGLTSQDCKILFYTLDQQQRAQESTSTLLVSPSAINIMIADGQAAVWRSKDWARKLSVCL